MADTDLYAFNKADSLALLGMLGGGNSAGTMVDPKMQVADIYIAVATSTITARAGTTLGTGTARLKYIDGSNVLQNAFSSDHSVVNSGSAIANGAYVLAFRCGTKYAVVELC